MSSGSPAGQVAGRFHTCDSYSSLTLDGPLRADRIVDATAMFDTKMAALRQHASQPSVLGNSGTAAHASFSAAG
ncbi:hypothetical protein GCM10009665_19530 [Kitasatospora nipponensis]|uniref:FXSXX-COOH protein n=1 Tax=Kitasatospora nipponensis TaxID=258049 RepID=A0ABN1W0S2_9ACTN